MFPKLDFLFTRVFPFVFVAAGAVLLFIGTRGLIRANESTGWPTADGEVVSSSVKSHRSTDNEGRRSTSYHADIRYTFSVDGKQFDGDRVAYGDYGSNKSKHAQSVVNRYPAGKEVAVYYMPSEPEECLLEPGIKGQTLLLPGLGLVFFLVGSLLAVFLPILNRRRAGVGVAEI